MRLAQGHCIEQLAIRGTGVIFTMNETLPLIDETVPEVDLQWQQRLDELVRGECSEDAFMDHVLNLREAGSYTAWNVIALLDQRYRRGQLAVDTFRSIESKIAQSELADLDYGMTIDLLPAGPSSHAVTPTPQMPTPGLHAGAAAPRASADPAVTVPEIGSTLRHRYVIERRLGTGGMGTVFKALDHFRCDLPEGQRHVALKFLHQRIKGRSETLSDLRREFYFAQALAHPNIVKVYELDEDDGFVFFTMEFLEGELLSGVIERLSSRKISRSSAWTLIQGMGAGLAHAHSRNVVHADLKPHNIMITNLDEVRVLDFGAASSSGPHRPTADADPKSNSKALTPAYASCELLDGKPADPRDDLYALACVSYELLAGEHPFQRRRSTEARDLGLIARRPHGLTRTQWEALAQGLSWRREDRSISVTDWLARLSPSADASNRLDVPLEAQSAAEPASRAPVPALMPVPQSMPALSPVPTLVPAPRPTPEPVPPSVSTLMPAPSPAAKTAPKPVQTAVPKSASVLKPASRPNSTFTPMYVLAALAIVVLGLGLWLLLNRRSIETSPVPTTTAADSQPNSPISPHAFAPKPLPTQPMSSAPSLSTGDATPVNYSSIVDAAAPGARTAAVSQVTKSDAAPHKARSNGISLSGSVYRVRPRQNFAELHVQRTSGAPGSTSFVWWTEAASAAAGIDFVPQPRVTQLLPAGTRAASLFVRLLPNASRKHSAVFYVVIGEPGNGASLGHATRTAVVMPAS